MKTSLLITLSVITGIFCGALLMLVIVLNAPIDRETTARFKEGQILYPDYVHQDTLVVYDAEYLNQCLSDGRLKTDGDIAEILNETCVKYIINPHEYQLDITEDSTYIYDGRRLVGVMPYDSTQTLDKIMLEDNL